MNGSIRNILKQYWGFDSFRPVQEEIILSVLAQKDTLALLPTGGGKSLCYQVPAMCKDGLCLVISPLIALMKDQVENLRKKNITAFALWSGMSRNEVINTLKVASASNCKFLYVSPERLGTTLFKEYLPALHINLIAVDEAHCISQWGYDFRPPYLSIGELREELPGVPLLALTASATPEVQKDICEKLRFTHYTVFKQSFARKNLSYSVFNEQTKIIKIEEVLKNVPGSSIVYCKTRKRVKEICDLLKLKGFSADFYHAGLTHEDRAKKQEAWMKNEIRIIVCTNAFGMGIDKPDVRTVIHADVPDCLENYYQEAGRAGRDGKKSYAVLLFNQNDLNELKNITEERYPPEETIKLVYQSVCDYLQVPSAAGDGLYFDFDLADFSQKFSLDAYTVMYSLKVLEQESWLSFNEQVFIPSSVQFIISKEELYQFENDHPQLEPMMKTLLRAYAGVFDFPVSISETLLVKLLKKSLEEVKNDLSRLHQLAVIEYKPQKDKPQLLFLKNRVRLEDFYIKLELYHSRKKIFSGRVKKMQDFLSEPKKCRSVIIANYFGDEETMPCGICDNCIHEKNNAVTKEEFEKIHQRIIDITAGNKMQVKEIEKQLAGIKKEKAWKVIQFLQAENKIEVDRDGWLTLK